MYIIIGVEAIPHSGTAGGVHVIDIAAVAVDLAAREVAAFESLVRPDEAVLASLKKEALGLTGLSPDELRAAPAAADAAERLRAFINANQGTAFIAYNVQRARRLLRDKPWDLASPWECSIRERVLESLYAEDVIPDLKLYEAALFLKIPVPIKRRALSSARLCAEILGKMERETHNISDANFLREAEYTMEEGL